MHPDPDELEDSAARLEAALARIARARPTPSPTPAPNPALAVALDALIARLRAALEETA